MMINGGLTMLKQIIPNLPESQEKVAKYIIDNSDKVINYSAAELGEKSKTSSAAVMRLCKSLGVHGLQELKLRIFGDLKTDKNVEYRDIQPNESIESVLHKMTENSLKSIKETSEIINIKEIENAVNAIIKAKKLVFFGEGASGIIAEDAQQKFIRIDKNAAAYTDIQVTAMALANIKKGDVFFGVSYSGETPEVSKLMSIAKERGAVTISLTKYGINSLSDISDIKLYSSSTGEGELRSAATSSRIAQLHVIDVVFMCVATKQYDKTIKYLDQTRLIADSLKHDRWI